MDRLIDKLSMNFKGLLNKKAWYPKDSDKGQPPLIPISSLIIENSHIGIFIINEAFQCVYANTEIANILGCSPEKIVGSDFRDYLPQKSMDAVFDLFARRQKGEQIPGRYEVEFCRKDGERRTAEINMDVIKTQDQQILTVVQAFDVSDRKRIKEEIEKSEKKYRLLVETIQDYVFEHDLSGNFTYVNKALIHRSGYTRDELIGMNYHHYIMPEDVGLIEEFYKRIYETREPATGLQYRAKSKNGDIRYYEAKGALITDEQNLPKGWRSIAQDITEKKQVEINLKKSEKKYHDLFENVLDFIFIHDLEGNFIETNARYVTEVGGMPDVIATSNLRDLIPKKFRLDFDVYLKRIKNNGRDDGVVAIQIPSGEVRTLEYKNVVLYDDNNRPAGVMGSARDITEHIKDKRALKESKERYQMIVENVEDLVFEQDLKGNFTFVNEALIKAIGYSKKELLGTSYRDYTLPEEQEKLLKFNKDIYKTGKPGFGLQHKVIRKDGSSFYVETINNLIKNSDGKPIGYRGISRDITERIRAEKILKESEQHLKEIIEGTPVPTVVFDKNYNIEHWNRACEELTGIKASKVIGKNKQIVEKLIKQPILPDCLMDGSSCEEISKWFGSECKKSAVVKNAYEVEAFFHKLGKRGKWLFITASPLENSDGATIGAIETILDITAIKRAEENLKKSEKKYHDFFENVLDLICIHDLKGNILETNAPYILEVGGSPDAIPNRNIRDFMSDELRPHFDDYLKRIIKNGRDQGVMSVQIPSGEVRILEYKNLLLHDDENRPISVLGSARDITEHINDKKALRDSKARYQMILENVGDFIFEIDLAGNYTFVNEALIKTSGYSKEELTGMNYRDYTFPEEREAIETYFFQIFSTGETGKCLQHRVIRKDGEPLFIELVVSLIKDNNGQPAGFRGVARDVTERRRAEKILKESEQQLKEIIEGSPIATIVFNKNQQITHWNRACEELTGILAVDIIGKDKQAAEKLIDQPILPDFLVHDVPLEDISAFYGLECRKSTIIKNAYEIELFSPKLGENGKWLFLTLAFLRGSENNIIGVIETLWDVTPQKQAEQNLLKMHNALEEKVEDRTRELQETNIALEVLLKKRENDKKKFEEKVAFSIKEVLTPHLELLKKTRLDKHQKVYLEILEDNFKEIASPFMSKLSDNIQKFTRTELQIINLIKQNKITKEIAELMGVSTRTVETHRDNIRKKLGIKNKKANLGSFLLAVE